MNRQQRIDGEKQTVERIAGLIASPKWRTPNYLEIERKVEEVRRLIDELSSDVISPTETNALFGGLLFAGSVALVLLAAPFDISAGRETATDAGD